MKFSRFLQLAAFFMLMTLALSSCQDDDPYANLKGTFTLTDSTVDGVDAGPVGGTLVFNNDKSGTIDIDYVVGATQFSLSGNFNFTANENTLTLNPGASDEEVWTRVEDEKNKQSFAFDVPQAGALKGVVLIFTK